MGDPERFCQWSGRHLFLDEYKIDMSIVEVESDLGQCHGHVWLQSWCAPCCRMLIAIIVLVICSVYGIIQ